MSFGRPGEEGRVHQTRTLHRKHGSSGVASRPRLTGSGQAVSLNLSDRGGAMEPRVWFQRQQTLDFVGPTFLLWHAEE